MRMRKKRNIVTRMEKCANLLIPVPMLLRGGWREAFADKNGELHLELGAGKGRFTTETAKAEPHINLVAIEKVSSALITALETTAEQGLNNILYIHGLADNLAEYFAPGEISRIYINFCDPWPAARHEKRRLTSGRFLELYKTVLKKGGEIHFKTDNQPLFEFSLEEFVKTGFTLQAVTQDLHSGGIRGVMTDYEKKFHAMGVPICRFEAVY